VGESVLCSAGVQFLFSVASHEGTCCHALVKRLLGTAVMETRKACLQYLHDNLESLDIVPEDVIVGLLVT